ncbi:hypothetical protein DFH08DRAFT_1084492 [Mycena albidolilacea]|uniref:Uncharacterized protein n=1 Tax=Mycena albidolilacea TaxID=1033008 RepID=A0AAD6ZLV8_9AGAR|nr:hypothetical protein DFH08DRAFT_1084492 [Mycena albidolilacea]
MLALAVPNSYLPVAIQARGVSSCIAQDRVLVKTHNVSAAGHEIQVSTKACSADVLISRAVEKRQVFNSCAAIENTLFQCVTNQGAGPLFADCTALSSAIVAVFEQAGDPPLFTVSPQFVQEFSLGTCLYAWINQNPVGGATLQCSYSYVTSFLAFHLDESCILAGDTGGFSIVSNLNPQLDPASLDWNFDASFPTAPPPVSYVDLTSAGAVPEVPPPVSATQNAGVDIGPIGWSKDISGQVRGLIARMKHGNTIDAEAVKALYAKRFPKNNKFVTAFFPTNVAAIQFINAWEVAPPPGYEKTPVSFASGN